VFEEKACVPSMEA